MTDAIESWRKRLREGLVIPACPLALGRGRTLDERRQRALLRYYGAAGAGGVAVGVHTTQFAIRDPKIGLFRPILELAMDELSRFRSGADVGGDVGRKRGSERRLVAVAGVCGSTEQAVREATLARDLGYDAGLLSLGALREADEGELLAHCRAVAGILPLFGFYLQPAAGGRLLSHGFWRRFAEIPEVVAVKIAPFDRYQTIDVVRAIVEAGREDVALYTGNDDNMVLDLLTPYRFAVGGRRVTRHIVGGLLGQWAVWTRRAVEIHRLCRQTVLAGEAVPVSLLRLAVEWTDANAALFDPANGFAGCIPGLHEILRRQGLLRSTRCLDPRERLSRGQRREIDRVLKAYPHLTDDAFVEKHLAEWLRD